MPPITPEQRAECNSFGIDNICHDCQDQSRRSCEELVRRINEVIESRRVRGQPGTKGLIQRRQEQMQAIRDNRNNVFNGLCPPGTMRFVSHQIEILKMQNHLRDLLNSFTDPNRNPPCNNSGDMRRDAFEQAEQRLPEAGINQHFDALPEQPGVTAPDWGGFLLRRHPALRLMPPGLLQNLMRPAGPGMITA